MKNIFLLPTIKKSRICKSIRGLFLQKTYYTNTASKSFGLKNKHLYIVSDDGEPLKEGEWCLNDTTKNIDKCIGDGKYHFWKKIILTTDLDLIADGVHEIPDSFIATYILLQNEYIGEVVNHVEITKDVLYDCGTQDTFDVKVKIQYIISIPSDESKNVITYTKEDMRKSFEAGRKMCWSDIEQENLEPYYYDFNEWFENNKK